MPLCKKCGGTIVWNRDDYAETGKWRPFDEDTDEPHNCSQNDWGQGSGGVSRGGIDAVDAISIGATMTKLEDKMDVLNKTMLKIVLEVQTLRSRVEGQMPLFPEITAKPVSEPILDPADITEEG